MRRHRAICLRILLLFVCVTFVDGHVQSASKKGKGGKGGGGGGGTGPRIIQFAGYDWFVKSSSEKVGPGPNLFSNSSNNVWVDSLGQLHLRITRRKKHWYCAEVVCQNSFGYGSYHFALNSRVDDLDPNVVLGLFTWNDDPAYDHREIDIEFARWGDANNPTNAQYVVQPYYEPDHLVRFIQPAIDQSTHSFAWGPGVIDFQSLTGHRTVPDSPEQEIASATYIGGDVPVPGGENPRINLWLRSGLIPTDRNEVEVVISDFSFTSAP